MANILGTQTVNGIWIVDTDTNPTLTGGVDAPIGSMALAGDGSGSFYKYGAGNTDWVSNSHNGTNIVIVDSVVGVGDFTSIAAAVASITTASSINPFVVMVNAGLYIEPTIVMKSWITVKGESSITTIVQALNTSDTVFTMADQSFISDLQIQGSTDIGVAAVVYSSPTTPQTDAIAYVENVRFGANYTHAKTIGTAAGNCILQCSNIKYGGYPFTIGFHVTNDGSGIGRMQLRNVTSTNGGIITTAGLIFALADKPSCAFIVNGCLLTKATGAAAGIGFQVEDGGSLRLTAINFQRWATAIYAPNTGAAPSIYGTALNFENNTKDVVVQHPNATGKFEGTDTYLKTEIPVTAPIYEINTDPRIITVAVKGGDFTSIADAVNSLSGTSSSNRYVIKVGAGTFTEPLIDLSAKPYVSIVGASIQTTLVEPDANNHHVFSIGVYNELSFFTIQNAGAGYAAIAVLDSGDFSQAHKISIVDCDTGILITSATQDTIFYGEYIDINGTYSYGTKVEATLGFIAFANLENYYNFPTAGLIATNFVKGVGSEVTVLSSSNTGYGNGTAVYLEDGGVFNGSSIDIESFDISYHIANVGVASSLDISGGNILDSSTWDLLIQHPTANVRYSGLSSHTKISNVSSNAAWAFLDVDDNEFEITKQLSMTFDDGTHTNISTLLLDGATMGVMNGGELTDGGTFDINIAAGFGYYELLPTTLKIFKRKDWVSQTLTLLANQDLYIYFNNSGILTTNGSQPDTNYNILLGRVVTNSASITLIDMSPAKAQHTSNKYGDLFMKGMGSIYASGSLVTENVGTPFHIDVTGGIYYFASNKYAPTGGTDLTFTPTLSGVVQAPTQLVEKKYDLAGVLTVIPAGEYAKHSLYVVGEGAEEKYFLVYATTTYTLLVDAQGAEIPLPPTWIKDSVTLISGIVVQQGASNITDFIDQRPVIGFKAASVSSTSDHTALTNLILGNAGHTQFMMLDGTTPMAGSLNMGTNNITNAGTFNSVVVEAHAARHLPNGLDPLTTAAPTTNLSGASTNAVGIQNSFSRSDHSHAITGAALTRVNDTNVTLTLGGSPTSALLNAASLTLGWTGTLSETRGGTNQSTYTEGDILYASAANTLSKLGIGTAGQVLKVVAGVPSWQTDTATGTVTSVSVVTANGISGSVATATTTPAITLTLGAITPTTVNGNTFTTGTGTLTLSTFTLTVAGTSSISGTNTGDQTITLTGDVTGSGTGSFATTIGAGKVTNAMLVNSSITINGTSISLGASGTVTAAAGTLTGTTLNATVVSSSLTSVGTLTGGSTGTGFTVALNASTISGNLTEVNGGTNQTTYTTGDILYASAANTLSKLGIGTAGQVLKVVAGVPSWETDAATGTVTSVSVTTNQGVSGSVLNPTTTPAITLSLGALTGVTSFNGLVITANTGAITTGTWNATIIGTQYGGTGVDNSTNTSGSFLRSNGANGNYVASTLTLPNSATTGDILIASGTNAIGSLADVAVGRVLISGGVGVSPSYSASPILGVAGTIAGTIGLSGATSGVVTIQTAATAGTWNLTLPTSAGSNGQVLQTNGSGVTSWATVGGTPTSQTLWTSTSTVALGSGTGSALGSGVGSLVIAANTLTSGKVIRVTLRGNLTLSGSNKSLTLQIKVGAVVITSSAFTTLGISPTSVVLEADINVYAAGGVGVSSIVGNSWCIIGGTVTGTANSAVSTIDTTVNNTLDINVSVNTLNTFNVTNVSFELLN